MYPNNFQLVSEEWVSSILTFVPVSSFGLSQSNVHCKAAMHQKKPLAQLDWMLEDQHKHNRQDKREKEG